MNNLISFLGRTISENAEKIAQANRDIQWHKKLLDTALREAARGHNRDAIIRNHTQAIKALEDLIRRLTK